MVTFFVTLAILIGGYFVYGSLVEKIFKPTDNPTPAIANSDGVDYVPIPAAKAFLIQLLNIAGLGPILVLFLVQCGGQACISGLWQVLFLLVLSMTLPQVCCQSAMTEPQSPKLPVNT